MASKVSKTLCASCLKSIGQFKCEGCGQSFCLQHVTEHRQVLSEQLDAVIMEHDVMQQNICEGANQYDRLIANIAQWEEKSIEKIRQTANDIRKQAKQLQSVFNTEELTELKEQIQAAREDDNFFENDLRQWTVRLEKLKESVKTGSASSYIREDKTSPLIYSAEIFSTESNGGQTDASTPPAKLHPRLQYTNGDGMYVNPKSFLVSAIWYFYSPQQHRWFWTPYQNRECWMPVDSVLVRSGYYKDQVPAPINVEIIEYLRKNNPIPPDEILQVALGSEDRILTL